MSCSNKSKTSSFGSDEGCPALFVTEEDSNELNTIMTTDDHQQKFLSDPAYRRHHIIHSMHHPHIFQSTGAYFGDNIFKPCGQADPLSSVFTPDSLFHKPPIPRTLPMDPHHHSSKRLHYRRRQGECKSCVHWGQRKLFLSEIEFLTNHALRLPDAGTVQEQDLKKIVCIYAGAAPGNHLSLLASLFPMVEFVLVDPVPFHKDLQRDVVFGIRQNIQLLQEFMTEALATSLKLKYVDTTILFISDVRSVDYRMVSFHDLESSIAEDMDHQRRWHEILCPHAGMYKFRLPWKTGSTRYLAGTIYLPVWGPQSTTESRLVVVRSEQDSESADDISKILYCDWDHDMYQEKMFYFNCVTRASLYDHDFLGGSSLGIDHCYDCSSEVHILKEYIQKCWNSDNHDRFASITSLISQINRACHSWKTLADLSHLRKAVLQTRNLTSSKKRSRRQYSLKTYDIECNHVIEHTLYDPDTCDDNNNNNDNDNDNDDNQAKSYKYIKDAVQHIITDRHSAGSIESMLQAENLLAWGDVAEIALGEGTTSSNREGDCAEGILGYLGGSHVFQNSAADIWLWGILGRDFHHHHHHQLCSREESLSTCPSLPILVPDWPSLCNWFLARAPVTVAVVAQKKMDENQDQKMEELKSAIFYHYFRKEIITKCFASKRLLGQALSAEPEAAILLPVFILLTSSGCAYFYSLYPSESSSQVQLSQQNQYTNELRSIIGESPTSCISKFCLPTKHYHHLTLLSGMLKIQWHSNDRQILPIFSKRLWVIDMLMYEGQLLLEASRRQELLSWYMNDEFNFDDSDERLALLHLSGFMSIAAI